MLEQIPLFSDIEFDFARNLIGWHDLLLMPIYWVLLMRLALWLLKPASGKERILMRAGLAIKFLGSIAANLIYNLYYFGGDSNSYFVDGRIISKLMFIDPSTAYALLSAKGGPGNWPQDLTYYFDQLSYPNSATAWAVSRISGILELFSFQSILVTGMLFAFLSFLCFWKFFKKINELYPRLYTWSFAAIFMIPGVALWGSGIFKDTVCLSCMYLLFVYTDELLKRRSPVKCLVILIAAGYVLTSIRSYLLLSFALSMSFWLFNMLISRLFTRRIIHRLLNAGFVLFIAGLSWVIVSHIDSAEMTAIFDIGKILEQSALTGNYIQRVSQENGSAYFIGEIEPSIAGFARLAPAAINVTFFRPYLWEANKPLLLIAGLESLLFVIATVYLLIKVSPLRIIRTVLADPFILSGVCFCLVFAVFVGISSMNFGALGRYKIPALPLYMISILLILDKNGKLPGIKAEGAEES